MSEHNGHSQGKIFLTKEEKKELTRIADGLNKNLGKIEQILAKFNEQYINNQVANNISFLEAVHSLEQTLIMIEKITKPLKKLL